jgi:hypothetical protein
MKKKDFLHLSFYIVAILLFANIALVNRAVINLQKTYPTRDVLAAKTAVPTKTPTQPTIKELHIPFGGGSVQSSEWADVEGVKLFLDSQNYKAAKEIVFEASYFTPSGNGRAYVRLYNVTDNYPLWQTEMSNEGNTGSIFYMTSTTVPLASGNKLYQVQMKNTMRATTQLVHSRLRVSF